MKPSPWVVFSMFAGVLPAQQSWRVGSLGAALELPAGWKHEIVFEDRGEDQFQCALPGVPSEEVCFAVTECRGLYETEADLRALLAQHATVEADSKVEIRTEPQWRRASTRYECVSRGVRMAVRCDVLAGHGFAYAVLSWVGTPRMDLLDRRADEFLDGFEFPPVDAAWRRELAPVTQTVDAQGVRLTFDVRPFAFREQKDTDWLREFRTHDKRQWIYVFEITNCPSLTRAADMQAKRFRDADATSREIAREETRVGDAVGFRLDVATARYTHRELILPTSNDRWLVLRHSTSGSEFARPERDALFASVRWSRPTLQVQLPPLSPRERPGRTEGREPAFLDGTQLTHTVEGWGPSSLVRGPNGISALVGWGAATLLHTDGTASPLAADERITDAAYSRGEWHVVSSYGPVAILRDGVCVPQGFSAAHVLAVNDDLLLVRAVESPLPHDSRATRSACVVVRRATDGIETELLRAAGLRVDHMAACRSGERVLCAGQRYDLLGGEEGLPTLFVLDLGTKETKDLDAWDAIDTVAAADHGWLVTGRPRGRAHGIWHVRDGHEPEALVTALEVSGLQLAGDRLTLLCWSSGVQRVHVATLAHCAKTAARFLPIVAADLEAIGEDLMAECGTPPRTAAQVIAAATAARRFARERLRFDLPKGADLDRLIAIATVDPDALGTGGRSLLTLLAAAAGLEAGADWVEAQTADWMQWSTWGRPGPSSAFAVSHHVAQLLAAHLGWHQGSPKPMAVILSDTGGRKVVLGVDHSALAARIAESVPGDYRTAVANVDRGALRSAFAAVEGNSYLREATYDALILAGHVHAVEVLAGEWAAKASPKLVDRGAWLAARAARITSSEEALTVVRDTEAALRDHPGAAELYVVLGAAAERAFPTALQNARVSYERVLETAPWARCVISAKAAIARLDGK